MAPSKDAQPAPQDPQDFKTGDLVDRLQQTGQDNPLWNNLIDKVGRFVTENFRGARLPPGDRSLRLEELRSEVFRRIFLALHQYEPQPGKTFWSWVGRIADNARNDLFRAQRNERGKQRLNTDTNDSSISPGLRVPPDPRQHTPSVVMRGEELLQAFLEFLGGLDAKKAEVLRLRVICGLDYKEIAARASLKREVTARSMVKRAREQMEDWLRQRGHDLGDVEEEGGP